MKKLSDNCTTVRWTKCIFFSYILSCIGFERPKKVKPVTNIFYECTDDPGLTGGAACLIRQCHVFTVPFNIN